MYLCNYPSLSPIVLCYCFNWVNQLLFFTYSFLVGFCSTDIFVELVMSCHDMS